MLTNLWYVFVLLLAFPSGYLLAWLARDELVAGRKYFFALAIVSILSTIPITVFVSFKLPIILTLFFIAIISLIAVWKSHDRAFLGRKFAEKK